MIKEEQNGLSYRDAGVNIERANQLVTHIKKIAQRTRRPEVMAGIGGFGGLFAIPNGYKQPILVAGTDGVGTKLKLAVALKQHTTIGIDLVAMCVNDIITSGAEPLFFLDYFATGQLDLTQAQAIMSGIATGCELAGAALIGGETAEMPGIYNDQEYDLAGFCVGIVEKTALIDSNHVQSGDALIALASSGPHANGYSLIHKVLANDNTDVNMPFGDSTLGAHLLTPTRIYAKSILALKHQINLHAIAHITGGGLTDNIPRILPAHTQALIDTHSWQPPDIFTWIQQTGNIAMHEMMQTFNMGVGMILCVSPANAEPTLTLLTQLGERAWVIGQVASSNHNEPSIMLR